MTGIIELLQRRGLQKIARVKVVRHKDKRLDLEPLIGAGHFEAGYQAYQARPVFNCDYIVSCIGLPGFKARFIGVYRVMGQRPAEEVPLPSHLAYLENAIGKCSVHGNIWYDLLKLQGFEDLENRVVIRWGPGAKAWTQWATVKKDKAIIQMPVSPVHSQDPPNG